MSISDAKNFNSQAVIMSAAPLMHAVCTGMEARFDALIGGKHVKKVEDILLFMRHKSNFKRITLDDYKRIVRELYDGADQEALEIHLKSSDMMTAAYLDDKKTMDVNDVIGGVLMIYSRYGAAEKAQLLFTIFDADEDGFLTREELKQRLAPFFANLYTNLEILITNPGMHGVQLPGDFKPFLPGLRKVFDPAKIPSLVDKAFAAADRDGDNRISRQEWIDWTGKDGAFTHEWGSIGILLGRTNELANRK